MLSEELSQLSDEKLVALVMDGDRVAAAEFLRRNERVLASRYRWRLRSQPTRIADTDDFLSTLARRVDRFIAEHRVLASGPGRLFCLVDRIADRASREVVRRSRRVYQRERLGARTDPIPDNAVRPAVLELGDLLQQAELDELSRDVLRCWSSGLSHVETARCLGISPAASRKRYSRAIAQLRTAAAKRATHKVARDG